MPEQNRPGEFANYADYRMTDQEWSKVKDAFALVDSVTKSHLHYCHCELCKARMNLNCDMEEFRVISCVRNA